MRSHDWQDETGRRKVRTTVLDRNAKAAKGHVQRRCNPSGPDRIRAGDITSLRTGEGWLFLATVIDLYSRRVIGWSIATPLRTKLVADALDMAVATRGNKTGKVIFQSDRGNA